MERALSQLKAVGPKRMEALQAAGIDTVRQLLCRLPVDYRDMSRVTPLAQLRSGQAAAVWVRLLGRVQAGYFRGLHITRCRLEDESGQMAAVWYNQPWVKKKLEGGGPFLLYGRMESGTGGIRLVCPAFEEERGILPVYAPVKGIPPKTYRSLVAQALPCLEGEPDPLPQGLRRRRGLMDWAQALRAAHAPQDRQELEAARRRLAFEELLLFQAALWLCRGSAREGIRIDSAPERAEAFWRLMPFPPTGAQRRVLEEIRRDMAAAAPMARLVQGDVGCGKTAVALGALTLCVQGGCQGALMAPTEVLARQHFESAQSLLAPMGIRVGLLLGSLSQREKRLAHEAVARGDWQVVIGTHALISQGVEYARLGLVVTDEQHRFGVRQRTALSQKGQAPNVLVMSATPIPRTLSLILYGDLDISVIDEMPPGRWPVRTRVVPEDKREGLYRFIAEQAAQGHQTYVVCPLVEESEAVEASSAEAVYEQLRQGPLAGLRLGLAHGRMKSGELSAVLEDFSRGDIDVLVATTVVEVGVNVPNATVMVIESAERFGLAQLHQLRGRVGRGADQAWCFLMAQPNQRLQLLCQTNDGFVIAQKDMELRGAGEILGTRQSGLTMQGMGADARLLKEAHDEARSLLKDAHDPEAVQVLALARRTFRNQLGQIAMN